MKKSDLHREWARVLDMCEGTKVDPYSCVIRVGCDGINYPFPTVLLLDLYTDFKFAVAILEGNPVFVGDKVYANNCTLALTVEGRSEQNGYIFVGNCTNYDISILSWNPPKKTFILNGEELPCPDGNKGGYQISLLNGRHYFSNFSRRAKSRQCVR